MLPYSCVYLCRCIEAVHMCVFAGVLGGAHVCLCRCVGSVHMCVCADVLGQCTCVFLQVCWSVHICDCAGVLVWCTYVIAQVGWDSAHVCLCKCVGVVHMCICLGVLGSEYVFVQVYWGQCTCVLIQVYEGKAHVCLCRYIWVARLCDCAGVLGWCTCMFVNMKARGQPWVSSSITLSKPYFLKQRPLEFKSSKPAWTAQWFHVSKNKKHHNNHQLEVGK